MRRIALMLTAVLVAVIGLVPLASAAQAVPSVEAAGYTYDTPAYDPPGKGAASQRGPPAHGLAATAYDTVDRWSRGTLARPDGLTAPSSTTYVYPVMLGQVAQAAPTTARQCVVADGELSPVQPAQDAAETGIVGATRLSEAELATASRLQRLPQFSGRTFSESPHVGAEYVDDLGRSYDALGTPAASKYWNEQQFLRSIDSHVLKSNDFTVIDLTGFTSEQVGVVSGYVNSLPSATQATIVRIGF